MSSVGSTSSSASQNPSLFSSVTPSSGEASSQLPPSSTRARLLLFAAKQPDAGVNSFCGAVAGVASGIVTCPLDVIKTKLQAQGGYRPRNASVRVSGSPPYQGMFGTASFIWRQDGCRGMYRGLGPMLLGYLPTWSVYMSVYGAARDYYYTRTGKCLDGPSL